ncbi:MAG: microviridin/marinostatin family tricyclic proteinase inhibitor [Desmonostoc vinosum HA7617-LM4]|jgi:hypothetical protein|nr:microviridin/marinostatin family tricyclic proteinase inhibitor [Desmonostoc vinosum HA7617-LM4]
MSNIKVDNLDSQAVPFFARFLEGQSLEDLSEEEMDKVGGGCRVMTRKYPSDQEDGHGKGGVTEKFPSDNEDGGVVTLKFPSDNEDH